MQHPTATTVPRYLRPAEHTARLGETDRDPALSAPTPACEQAIIASRHRDCPLSAGRFPLGTTVLTWEFSGNLFLVHPSAAEPRRAGGRGVTPRVILNRHALLVVAIVRRSAIYGAAAWLCTWISVEDGLRDRLSHHAGLPCSRRAA